MATTITPVGQPGPGIAASTTAVEPATKFKPVKVWAGIGVFFLIIEAAALTGWIWTGEAKRTPTGEDPVPTWMNIIMRSWEVVGIFAALFFLYHFLVKPWRREGRITTDGLFCIVFTLIFWQDTGLNFFQMWSTYNSNFFNLGAWDPHILGWLSPNANYIAEPLVWVIPIYIYCVFGGAVVGCVVMRKAKERWPSISTFGLIMVCFAFFCIWDMILEPLFLMLGFYTYPGAIPWLTIFHGHYFQYPIYEAVMAGAWWTAFACCRYFKNDKGQTLAERGIDELMIKPKAKTGVRFLALTGIVNVAFLVYNIPAAIMGLYAAPWPEDITKRSYMMQNNICGEGSTYACSGPGVPIPRPASAHLDPNGNLIEKNTGTKAE